MSYKEWSLTIEDNRHPFGEVEVVSWNIAGREYRTDDTDRPRTDGIYFGQDFANAGDVTIELIIRAQGTSRQERFEAAMSLRNEFTRVWNGDSIRFTPGAVAELEIAGLATVEGRPRHVDWDDTNATFGIIRGTALFVRNLDQAFAPGEGWQEVTVGLVPDLTLGLKEILTEPLTIGGSSERPSSFEVISDEPVWPIISVQGPLQVGGKVELTNGWSLHLNRGLAYDQVAVFNTHPTQRSMTLNGKTMNLLAPSGARLSQLSMAPGLQEISLRGTSLEGTASVTVKWRNIRKVI